PPNPSRRKTTATPPAHAGGVVRVSPHPNRGRRPRPQAPIREVPPSGPLPPPWGRVGERGLTPPRLPPTGCSPTPPGSPPGGQRGSPPSPPPAHAGCSSRTGRTTPPAHRSAARPAPARP